MSSQSSKGLCEQALRFMRKISDFFCGGRKSNTPMSRMLRQCFYTFTSHYLRDIEFLFENCKVLSPITAV